MKKTCSLLFKILAFYPILAILGYAFGFGTIENPEGGLILGLSEYWISLLPEFYNAIAQFIVLFGIGLALSKTSKIKGVWGYICYAAALIYGGYHIYQAIIILPQIKEQAVYYNLPAFYLYLNTFVLQLAPNIFYVLVLLAVGKLARVSHRQANEELQYAYESTYEPECACGCGECGKDEGCTEEACAECDNDEACCCGECDDAAEEACDCGCEEADEADAPEATDEADAE